MFDFGNPEDTAALYAERLETEPDWPSLPRKHAEEMSEEELRVAITYLNVGWHQAQEEGAAQAVLDVIQRDYDEVFTLLATGSRKFRKFACTKTFICPGADKHEAKKKYRAIALSLMTR